MVISDYMPEIKEAYGDTIPMYKNKEELKTLLNYYLNNESERKALAKQAQKITLEKFTNHAIAKQMLDAK
jgi:spore maturation protein CgeB